MARLNIALPDSFDFSTEIELRPEHINAANHLDNVQLIVLLSEARKQFFNSLGYTQTDVEGLGTVIADTAVQYVSEAFEGETLVFELATDDFNKYGCDLLTRVRERATGRDVARAKTGFVFYDYAARKIARIPEAFLARLEAA